MRSSPTRLLAALCAVLLIFTALLVFLAKPDRVGNPPLTASPADPVETKPREEIQAAPRMEKKSRSQEMGGAPIVDSDETWDFNQGGQTVSIRLALDEAVVREPNGKDRIIPLNPPATSETLSARLAAIDEQGLVLPVAYVVGQDRSQFTRRIVTPDLSVKMEDAAADAVAAAHDLVVKSRPDYAPGWIIMSAPSPFAALDAMVNLREVREVASADVLLAVQRSLRALPNDPLVTNQWHLKKTAASSAGTDVNIETIWNYPSATGSRGTGIRVGVVDDGLQTAHPDLAVNVDTANDKDWNGNDADPNPGTGDDHGTACAGNVAARGNNGIGVSGTAPNATLVGMRLIAAATTDAQEAEAMYYLPQLIEIKSNSWGPNDTGNILEGPGTLTAAALRNAAELGRGGKGNIILWAGGNGGSALDNSNYDGYANSIYTIAIGATNSSGNRSSYSEPGSNVVVCAPSDGALGITTVDRTGANGYESGDYTSTFGGTSSATPTAAGIVALMLEKNPNLGWRDVQEILFRSAAKIKPTDADWVTNPAGLSFNHNFGAGLIDATAAVNLSETWTNLPAHANVVSTQSGLNVAIPNNNATGITRSFNLASSNLRVEHVTVKVSINHSARGNLAITLTSPGGMASKLSEVHTDNNSNYSAWTFSTVRNWGESSTGIWTLKIADLSNTTNTTGGTLTSAELTVFGSSSTPVNPAPLAQITQPAANQVFSPGTSVTVNVSASDLAIGGSPGSVASVQLFDNEVPIGTDSSAPYSFTFTPSLGSHTLVAVATDSEGATGTSTSIGISVVNQTPVITSATLSATGQSFSDVPLTVSSVVATDAENDAIQYAYQWQSSTNQTLYSDVPGATTSTAPALAGTLLRCVITASDGNTTSDPFTTQVINLLTRPTTSAVSGTAYSYESGLILRGTDSQLTRPAIIHEISQGPSGGSAEWIEILTLQEGSLAYWDLQDEAGNILIFADDVVWDDIPAGTLIVVYNGASKDPLLPADDLDPSDGRMVVSSSNGTYFDLINSDSWLSLGNSGDSIFLNDAEAVEVHSIAYGNSVATTPNIGSVGSGKSAYYAGDTDAGADVGANWTVTTSLSARAARALLPGITLSGGSYSQNFNTTPGATGTTYPDGWAAYSGNTQDNTMVVGSSSSTSGGNYNYGSRIGLLGSGSTFDPSSIVMAVANTSGLTGLVISYDVVKILEQTRSCTFKLQYSTTSPTENFIDIPDGIYTSGTIAQGTVTPFTAISLPPGIENQSSTVYLRWYYETSGSGGRDGLALDNVVIATSGPVTPPLTLSITPTTFAENAGASAASGTVSIPAALGAPLVVNLVSSDLTEATVPATVTIAAGQTVSPSFAVAALDDALSDGSQTVTVTASAAGYADATGSLQVTDDEVSLTGVTPGAANTPPNLTFITNLRNGALNSPALFRFGSGANIPVGLTLDPATGVLSGTIALSNTAGDYLIVIERYNSLGESVSQSYTLTISPGASDTYLSWIATQNVGTQTGMQEDADGDGLANAIENHLGTNAGIPNAGLTQVSAPPQTLVFRHPRTNAPASDLTVSYEWSADLVQWHPSAASSGGTTVTIGTATIEDTAAPANDLVEVTATVTGTPGTRIFLRIKATQP